MDASVPEKSARGGDALARARRVARAAAFIALVVVSGRAFKVIPNVEWATLLCFTAGLVGGAWEGLCVATGAELLYSLTSPYGLAPPLILAAQVVGMSAAGLSGGWMRRGPSPAWAFALVGLLVTTWFDLCTNLATAVQMGTYLPTFAAALPFTALHLLSNVALFAALGPLLQRRLASS